MPYPIFCLANNQQPPSQQLFFQHFVVGAQIVQLAVHARSSAQLVEVFLPGPVADRGGLHRGRSFQRRSVGRLPCNSLPRDRLVSAVHAGRAGANMDRSAAGVLSTQLFQLARFVQRVGHHVAATLGRERNDQSLALSDASTGRRAATSAIGSIRAARPAQLAFGLAPRSKQLGHHGQFDLVDAQPFVQVMAKAGTRPPPCTSVTAPMARSRSSDSSTSSMLQFHQRIAVVLLVAAGRQGVDRHRIGLGRGLGLFDQHADHAAIDGRQGPPAGRWVSEGRGSDVTHGALSLAKWRSLGARDGLLRNRPSAHDKNRSAGNLCGRPSRHKLPPPWPPIGARVAHSRMCRTW